MAVNRPSPDQLITVGADLGITLTLAQAEEYSALMARQCAAYDIVDGLPDNVPVVKYPRTPGYRPSAEDNRLNAWYLKTEIRGAPSGKLVGKTVVLKDNVCLAGVPMMNGASSLEGFVPDLDATIVTRMLDAGATIVGKSVCEYFCLSGGSHTSVPSPVHNPHRAGYSAGGSSSGSGALVAVGEVDMAIGGDQGGSIRIPASYCGIYGMKPTFGLVPYTGVMPIEATVDHTGPMTKTVQENALLLEVIAGADGLDPRQYGPKTSPYTEALTKGAKGLRIGVLKEGFTLPNMEKEVKEKVIAGAQRFARLGAEVEDISIPEHPTTAAVWAPIAIEGSLAQMMLGNGMGWNWKGLYTVGLLQAHASWREQADTLSESLKISMLAGSFFSKRYHGKHYAKAQNITRRMKAAYDRMFEQYDLLLLPTLPTRATPLPSAEASISEKVTRAFDMMGNVEQFDATGHPAMSIPCGLGDGLPIGLMLVGKDYAESTIYQAAAAFEASGDWRTF